MGPGGEAILDPRFLVRCPAHSPAPAPAPPVPLPKIDSPLFTIEKIIESELKTLSQPGPAPAPAPASPAQLRLGPAYGLPLLPHYSYIPYSNFVPNVIHNLSP